MIENESRLDKLQQKAKIRERYKGIDPGMLEVIPAKKQADFYDDEPRRVAVYVRVSTDDPRQTSSYELQKNYYEDMVEKHPGWALVSIYPDEGVCPPALCRGNTGQTARRAALYLWQLISHVYLRFFSVVLPEKASYPIPAAYPCIGALSASLLLPVVSLFGRSFCFQGTVHR